MIFVSTGGFTDQKAMDIAIRLFQCGIDKVELSGGIFDAELKEKIANKPDNLIVQAHNYFPTPKKPMVVNLSSNIEIIRQESIEFLKAAIEWNNSLGIKYISFHGGFLVDPKPNELGKPITGKQLIPRDIGIRNFMASLQELTTYAKSLSCKLLVENNVLTEANFKNFGENPFLFVDPDETSELLSNLPESVGLLLDVAHLKVSANTLGFPRLEFINQCNDRINALHLSDNDGLSDSNQPVHEDSWFWKNIPYNVLFTTLEIYANDMKLLKNQVELSKKIMKRQNEN